MNSKPVRRENIEYVTARLRKQLPLGQWSYLLWLEEQALASLDSSAVQPAWEPMGILRQGIGGWWFDIPPSLNLKLIRDTRTEITLYSASATPASTAKESLTAGGERCQHQQPKDTCAMCARIAPGNYWREMKGGGHSLRSDERKGERRDYSPANMAAAAVRTPNLRRRADRRHPSAEPINADTSTSTETMCIGLHQMSNPPAPASGQAEAMREGAAKICDGFIGTEANAATLAELIRALPLPPESEAEGLVRQAVDFLSEHHGGAHPDCPACEFMVRAECQLAALARSKPHG